MAARSADERAPLLKRVDASEGGYFSRGFVARLVLGALALTAVSAASFGFVTSSSGLLGIDWSYDVAPGQDDVAHGVVPNPLPTSSRRYPNRYDRLHVRRDWLRPIE